MQKFLLLYSTAVQLSATSALGLTIWQETVQTEGSIGARKFGCEQQCFQFNKIGHISSEYQGNAEGEKASASEKLAIACYKSARQQMRMHGFGGVWMLTDAGEQSHWSTVETEGGGSANH